MGSSEISMFQRVFTIDDQNAFALLSGDNNPLHVDILRARRTQFGRPIVHGMHLLFWALEKIFPTISTQGLGKILVTLRQPIGINEAVSCRKSGETDKGFDIHIESRGTEHARFRIELSPGLVALDFVDRDPPLGTCHEYKEEDLAAAKGVMPLEMSAPRLVGMFPTLSAKVPHSQLAVILATTRIVGTRCPGLNSIYSGLTIHFESSTSDMPTQQMDWHVEDYDDRFRRLTLNLKAQHTRAVLHAMLRPAPQKQPTVDELKVRLPEQTMFAGQKSLVIGGSRGLGELCAKILAAGGADVRLTYHRGQSDAEAVVADIRAGGGKAEHLAYDILNPPSDLRQQLGQDWQPTHVYYFPTPPIFVATRDKFSAELFNRFCRYYVEGFYTCWATLRTVTANNITLFYPSSVAVSTCYPMMGEYAAAKAAGENLCGYLRTIDRKLQIKIARLPRLPSDQTLSVTEVDTDDPVETLLDFIDGQNMGAPIK